MTFDFTTLGSNAPLPGETAEFMHVVKQALLAGKPLAAAVGVAVEAQAAARAIRDMQKAAGPSDTDKLQARSDGATKALAKERAEREVEVGKLKAQIDEQAKALAALRAESDTTRAALEKASAFIGDMNEAVTAAVEKLRAQ